MMRPSDHELEQEPSPPQEEDLCPVCNQERCECPEEGGEDNG